MLTGYNIVYFGGELWDGLWNVPHEIVSTFAQQNKVLYVEPRPYLRKVLASFHRGELDLSDLRRPQLRQISENLFIFSYPTWAPISGHFPLAQLTSFSRRRAFRSALRELRMSQPIVWFHRPNMVDLINEVPSPRLRLYHAVDEYTTYGNMTPARRRRIEELEKEMMNQVDAVIVTSKKLYDTKKTVNSNVYLVPNGVNYQAYTAALADPQLPDELQAINHPRLGYIGHIGDRINVDILKEIAQKNPEWSLVFLGEVRFDKSAEAWQTFQAMPNVHHLGQVKGSCVPHYVKGFDVGLMPYVQNRHAEYISPLKLYDYLAAGIPVASLSFPAACEFSQYIHLADTPQHFSRAVCSALADTTLEHRQTRRNVASQHSWEARIAQLSEVIQTQLAAKGAER